MNQTGKLKKKDYRLLFKKNLKVYSKHYVFYYQHRDFLALKVASKKKIGNAVVRNYFKRRLREIIRSIVLKSGKKNIFILAILIRKHRFTYQEEYRYIQESIKPIIS